MLTPTGWDLCPLRHSPTG